MNLKNQRETTNVQYDDPIANSIRSNGWMQQFYPSTDYHGRPFAADYHDPGDTKAGNAFLLKMLFHNIMNTKYSVEQ